MVHTQLGLRYGTLNREKTKKHKALPESRNPKWDFATEMCVDMRQKNILAFLIVALLWQVQPLHTTENNSLEKPLTLAR